MKIVSYICMFLGLLLCTGALLNDSMDEETALARYSDTATTEQVIAGRDNVKSLTPSQRIAMAGGGILIFSIGCLLRRPGS